MKKTNILLGGAIAFAALNVGNYAFASDNPFATVPQKTGYYQDVASLIHDGLIDGYTDSDFNAARPMTRYEMAIFTAKAMSKSGSAGAADTQRIQRLMKEFQGELTDLHVKVPGVKAKKATKKSSGPKVKNLPKNFDVSGLMRFRDDWGGKQTSAANGSKRGKDGFGGEKNHQLLWQMFTKFDIGAGWKGELDFIGAKSGNGSPRTTGENTDGYADVNKMFVTGPLRAIKSQLRFGHTKGSTLWSDDLIMGQYYSGGAITKKNMGKWDASFAYGKPDFSEDRYSGEAGRVNTAVDLAAKDAKKITYKNTAGDTVSVPAGTAYYYKDVRGISESDINPNGLGVNMFETQVQYRASKTFSLHGAWWHLHADKDGGVIDVKNQALNNMVSTYVANQGGDVSSIKGLKAAQKRYCNPDIGELGFRWNVAPKFLVWGNFAMSNMRGGDYGYGTKNNGDQNKAYAMSFRFGNVAPAHPHSYRFQIDLVHMEKNTGIKSSYDLKNKAGMGQRGFLMDYRYVPVTNVMFDFRWMHYKSLGLNQPKVEHGDQYRVQLYYYF